MTRALLSLLFLTATAPMALADVPPPPGYVETCTISKQQGEGEHCYSCQAWHGDRDACVKRFEGSDYSRRCRTRGASVWTEVWCHKGPVPKVTRGPEHPEPKRDEAAPAPAPNKDDDGTTAPKPAP